MLSLAERSRETLEKNAEFSDDTLLYSLHMIVGPDALVIDPVLLSLLVDNPGGKNEKLNVSALQRQFDVASEKDLLVILPLHHDGHWSLLATRHAWLQWYHSDSIRDYHRDRVVKVLECLHRLCIHREKGSRIFFYDNMPEQPPSYKCGHYLLFYAFVFVRTLSTSTDQKESEERLEKELRYVSEINRAVFEAHVTRLLRRNEVK